jgi:hypothetical protein
MKQLVILFLIIKTLIIATPYDYNFKIATPYDYIFKIATAYGLDTQEASLIANIIEEESLYFPKVPYQIFTALITVETGFRNVVGDDGKALGYCQIHKSAFDFVMRFYKDDLISRFGNIEFEDLLGNTELQIRVGYRYLHLIMTYLTDNNIIEALNFWNNSDTFYIKVFKALVKNEETVGE